MMELTTIQDLIIYIEPMLGSEVNPAIVKRLAYEIWGNYRAGDEIDIPDDLASLYLQLCEVIKL